MWNNHRGFSLVEVLLVIVLLALVGLAVWTWYDNREVAEPADITPQESAPSVERLEDLETAEEYLSDEADPDAELDTSELEATLGTS